MNQSHESESDDSDSDDSGSDSRQKDMESAKDLPKDILDDPKEYKSGEYIGKEMKAQSEDNPESSSKRKGSRLRKTVDRSKSDEKRKRWNKCRGFFRRFKIRRNKKKVYVAGKSPTSIKEDRESDDSNEPELQMVAKREKSVLRAKVAKPVLVGAAGPRESMPSHIYAMLDDFKTGLDAAPFEILPVPEALTREQIKLFFRRGFRPDHINLDGKVGFLSSFREVSEEREVIQLCDSERPIDFLIHLGFDSDDAALALEQRGVASRLQAALVEARIWVNFLTHKQGALLFLLAQMIDDRVMRFFLPMVEAIVNNRITSGTQVDSFMKVLLSLEETNAYLIPDSIDFQRLWTVGAAKDKKEVVERLIDLYNAANEASDASRHRHIDEKEMLMLEYLVHKYRPSLKNHMRLIATYIGRGLMKTKMQLDAAILFIAQHPDTSINTTELESFCGIDGEGKVERLAEEPSVVAKTVDAGPLGDLSKDEEEGGGPRTSVPQSEPTLRKSILETIVKKKSTIEKDDVVSSTKKLSGKKDIIQSPLDRDKEQGLDRPEPSASLEQRIQDQPETKVVPEPSTSSTKGSRIESKHDSFKAESEPKEPISDFSGESQEIRAAREISSSFADGRELPRKIAKESAPSGTLRPSELLRKKEKRPGWARRALDFACNPFRPSASPGGRGSLDDDRRYLPPFLRRRRRAPRKVIEEERVPSVRPDRTLPAPNRFTVFWFEASRRFNSAEQKPTSDEPFNANLRRQSSSSLQISDEPEQFGPQPSCSRGDKRDER